MLRTINSAFTTAIGALTAVASAWTVIDTVFFDGATRLHRRERPRHDARAVQRNILRSRGPSTALRYLAKYDVRLDPTPESRCRPGGVRPIEAGRVGGMAVVARQRRRPRSPQGLAKRRCC